MKPVHKPNRTFILVSLLIVLMLAVIIPLGLARASVDDSYTKALLHFEGSNHSTTYTDEAGNTWSNSSAEISTSAHKFGSSALKLNGYSQNIYSNLGASAQFGSADFTIDAWVYSTDIGVHVMSADTNHWLDLVLGSSHAALWMSSNCSTWNMINGTESTHTVSQNAWHHLALVRYGTSIKLYVDGAQEISFTSSATICNPTSNVYIGNGYGYIDELRVSKGIARWTAAFTPPSSIYEPTYTGTVTDTETSTPTYTPSVTVTPSPTFTPSETNTPTPTKSPTITPSPSRTLTLNSFGSSSTPSPTHTPSNTPTITNTPSPTSTSTPNPITSITWAQADDVNADLLNAMETYLLANPPIGEDHHRIYGVTDQSNTIGDWIIGVVNLVNVTAPDYEWNFENNVNWAGSLVCTGIDPSWTCSLYQPSLGGEGGSSGLLWPWRPGTSAVYGVSGIHGIGSGFLPGSKAIDFVGQDNWGSDSMPPVAYASADGTITMACHDDHSAGIVVDSGSAGKFLYLHLNKADTTLSVGNKVYAGRPISSLTYGSFGDYSGSPSCPTTCADGSDCRCGCASQANNEYHLHFATIPINNYIMIGGCQINTLTGNVLCGTTNYKINSRIPNGGTSSNTSNPGSSGGSTNGYSTTAALGGEHIWDGLVNGIVDIAENVGSLFPQHQSLDLANKVNNASLQIFSILIFVNSLQLFYLVPAFVIIGVLIGIEVVRWIINLWIKILNIIGFA
jgi:hypothetical protein